MQAKRILVIDDEQHIIDVVAYVLEENAFDVLTARDGDTGLRRFREEKPDLVVLDLMLPGIPGLQLFREMRALRADAPIIMLTSRADEIDRVLGLELGADDYVTKPFSTRELAARVKTVLRRASGEGPARARDLAFGPLMLDTEAFVVTYTGQRLSVTRGEFKLLECLTRYPARVFSRDHLVDRIYDGEHVVTDRSIDACVKRLRRKFHDIRPAADPIETVHGFGYKLNQDLEDYLSLND